jgi:hypothetical protein
MPERQQSDSKKITKNEREKTILKQAIEKKSEWGKLGL